MPCARSGRPSAAPRLLLTVLLSLLALLGEPPFARAAEATLNVDLAARQWRAVRLKSLPQGAVVAVEARTSGPIGVAFVDAAGYRRLPALARPLFRGEARRRVAFSVTISATGDHYVVLDNRAGADVRAVEVTVRARRGQRSLPSPAPEASDPDLDAADEKLREFQRDLGRLLVFDPFPIDARACGTPNAFAGDFGVVLCREYAQHLYAALGDRQKAGDALLFALFHEVAHVLLRQWAYPFYDNEDVADEMAAALLVLLGQRGRLAAKAEYFAGNPALAEALAKIHRDDRHSLSPQRARNLLRWAEDPDLLRRWQTVFVPRLQTAALERLAARPPAWADAALVARTLAERRPVAPAASP